MFVLLPNSLPGALSAMGNSMRSPIIRSTRRATRSPRNFSLLSLLLASAVALPAMACAQLSPARVDNLLAAHAAKLSPGLRADVLRTARRDSQKTLSVIIQTDGTTPFSLRPMLNRLSFAAFKAARPYTSAMIPLNGHGTLAARLTPQEIARLAADAHTGHISPDLPVRTFDAGAYVDYAMQATGADFALANGHLNGQNVTVAVVDTGIYLHNDLSPASRVAGWVDLVNNQPLPYDDNGHGTHVAGLVAGNGAVSAQYGYNAFMGRLAPQANLVGVKVLDASGGGSVSTVIAGIDWCVAHKNNANIRILNLSIGHPVGESYKTDPLCQACERAWKAGITVVCAAGNYGRSVPSDQYSAPQLGSITSPGNDPYVITVGAMNTRGTIERADDIVCSYSSRGPSAVDLVLKPDLVAPGNRIISLAAPGSALFAQASNGLLDPLAYGGQGGRAYLCLSGTSMAAPVVSGAAALLLQADPTLSPDTIKARLMLSATKVADMDYLSYGAGYLNVVGALQLTQVAAAGTLSPNLVRQQDGTVQVVNFGWGGSIRGQNFGWGGDIIDKKFAAGDTSVLNFGWGGDIIDKPTKLTDFQTAQNFNWNDHSFLGGGVFGGPIALPQNFGSGPNALWNGGVAPLNTPNQTDGQHLLFDGD